MNPPFPFIVGCGRSGSTLLRAMLDAHPDMVVPGESYFLEQLIRRRSGFVRDGEFRVDELVDELRADARFRTWEVDTDLVVEAMLAAEPQDLASAIRAMFGSVAQAGGGVRFADKTPAYSLCISELAELLPEAVFVHLVRDPRDVAASYRSASWGPRTLVSAAQMWRTRVGAAREAAAVLGPERYLEIHYEALVARPEQELRRVCDFIELPFDDAMLQHERSAAARATAGRDGGAHAALLERPRAAIRDWRTELSDAEAARVGAVVGLLATDLGYEPSPPVDPGDRVRLWLEHALAVGEAASLRFRRTRVANRLRGPWRVVRRRATLDQMLADGR